MVWLIVGLLVMAVTVIHTMRRIARVLQRVNCDQWPLELEDLDDDHTDDCSTV